MLQKLDLLTLHFPFQSIDFFLHLCLFLHDSNAGVWAGTEGRQYCLEVRLQTHCSPSQLYGARFKSLPKREMKTRSVHLRFKEESLLWELGCNWHLDELLQFELTDVNKRDSNLVCTGYEWEGVEIKVGKWRHLLDCGGAVKDAFRSSIVEDD